MRSRKSVPQPGQREHRGRGLCVNCYQYARHHGELVDYSPQLRSRDDLLDDYVLLRSEGLNWRQCAERLGMSYPTFERAMFRARADGDPRAARLGERLAVAS